MRRFEKKDCAVIVGRKVLTDQVLTLSDDMNGKYPLSFSPIISIPTPCPARYPIEHAPSAAAPPSRPGHPIAPGAADISTTAPRTPSAAPRSRPHTIGTWTRSAAIIPAPPSRRRTRTTRSTCRVDGRRPASPWFPPAPRRTVREQLTHTALRPRSRSISRSSIPLRPPADYARQAEFPVQELVGGVPV